MKFLTVFFIILLALTIYSWINTGDFSVSDIMPFSRTANHGFNYNYISLALILLAGWEIFKMNKKL